MNDDFVKRLERELKNFSIDLNQKQIEQFYQYYTLLNEWNTKVNLTAITEQDEVITKHFMDSLSLVKAIEDLSEKSYDLIDVGTGAGFPGIPLKIVFPSLNVTLLDSLNKRVRFLDAAIERLELKQIVAIHGRAEDIAHDKYHRERYDIAVSRAVANLSTLSEYCLPFVKIDGFFVAYKSVKVNEELMRSKHAFNLLGGKVSGVKSFMLGESGTERSLIKIEKISSTMKVYPRKVGKPCKEPLK